MKTGRLIHLHPLLLAVFPVFFLYSGNLDQVSWTETLLPAAVALALAMTVGIAARLVLRDTGKAAALVSVFFGLFYLQGLAAGAARRWEWVGAVYVFASVAVVLLIGVGLLLRRAGEGAPVFNRILTVCAVALWLPVLFRIAAYQISPPVFPEAEAPSTPAAEVPPPLPADRMPDIFYIVLDGYGRADVLRDFYLFDNRPFLDFLRGRGFYVADRSVANYPHTQQSLASALNMTYLDGLAGRVGEEARDRGPLLDMIQHSRTERLLRGWGYRIAAFSSGYSGTELTTADLHLQPPGALSEFQQNLLNFTPLPDLLERWTEMSPHDLHRRRVVYTFKRLPDLSGRDEPVFVFAHVVSPHPPFVFDSEGRAVEIRERFTFADGDHYMRWYRSTQAEYRRRYLDQLRYVNRLLEEAIEGILERASRPTVIILQSDHGPGSMFSYDSLERTNIRERFAILNAYLLPGGYEDAGLYPGISPVNNFRVVFNRMFDQEFETLEDRSYFVTITRPYDYIPVSVP